MLTNQYDGLASHVWHVVEKPQKSIPSISFWLFLPLVYLVENLRSDKMCFFISSVFTPSLFLVWPVCFLFHRSDLMFMSNLWADWVTQPVTAPLYPLTCSGIDCLNLME